MKQDTLQDYQERMLRVLVHIQQNLDQNPTLAELAGLAHFSPFHFHRIFRGMIGESLHAYLRRLRLERAAFRLRTSDDSILRVALLSGFESHAAFSRAFKSQLGLSPSDWRLIPPEDLPVLESTPTGKIFLKSRGESKMEVKIVKEENMRVAFVRHTGPYEQCGSAWEELCSFLGPRGFLHNGPRFIGLSYDDPEATAPENLRYDACVVVDDRFQPEGSIGLQILEGGTFAQAVHQGPYENLKNTYAALLGEWLPQSGREFKVDPTREIYINHPENTAPEDLVTEIYLALKDPS